MQKIIDISNMITDTKRLDYIERNHWEIESPDRENLTWVIYSSEKSLGSGMGCNKFLRNAIDEAIKNYEIDLEKKL